MARDLQLRSGLLLALATAFAISGVATPAPGQEADPAPTPYASIGAVAYKGPGRASTFDLSSSVIRIGVLAPLHGPEKADGEAIVRAARMALEEASQRAFPGGHRLELAIGDEFGPSWGQTADALLHLVTDDQALALITSANGATAHLSEQVGNRIGVPVLTLSTDPTTTEIDLPWIFRLGPSDSVLAETIAQDIYRNRGVRNIVLVAERDHDGRVGAKEFQKAVERAGAPRSACVFVDPLNPDYDSLLAELGAQPADAIVLWTRPETAGILAERLQKTQIRTPIYLSPQAAQESSKLDLRSADSSIANDPASAGVWTTVSHLASAPARKAFEQRYELETGRFPSPVAAEAYDAVALIAEAFRAAGPNRARVRDWVAKVKDFSGVSGTISFDEQGNNTSSLRLVRIAPDERNSWRN